jgi:hypothetical protein
MAINTAATKAKAAAKEAAVDAFADAAPVAEKPTRPPRQPEKKTRPARVAPAEQKSVRGNMVQTTITMTPEDLEAINQAAEANRMSRAAFIRWAVFQQIEGNKKPIASKRSRA